MNFTLKWSLVISKTGQNKYNVLLLRKHIAIKILKQRIGEKYMNLTTKKNIFNPINLNISYFIVY